LTQIPLDLPQTVRYSGIQHISPSGFKYILVQNLQMDRLYLPYKTIDLLLPQVWEKDDSTSIKGTTPRLKDPKEISNDTSTLAGSDIGTADEVDYSPHTFREDYSIKLAD
jgi:hypothetical protein